MANIQGDAFCVNQVWGSCSGLWECERLGQHDPRSAGPPEQRRGGGPHRQRDAEHRRSKDGRQVGLSTGVLKQLHPVRCALFKTHTWLIWYMYIYIHDIYDMIWQSEMLLASFMTDHSAFDIISYLGSLFSLCNKLIMCVCVGPDSFCGWMTMVQPSTSWCCPSATMKLSSWRSSMARWRSTQTSSVSPFMNLECWLQYFLLIISVY